LVGTASAVQAVFNHEAVGAQRRQRVLNRLRAEIASAPAPAERSLWSRLWQSWRQPVGVRRWQMAFASTLAVAALSFLGWRALPSRQTMPMPTRTINGIHALSHAEASAKLSAMARGDLSPDEARELWAHLVRCDNCFEKYRALVEAQQAAARGAVRLTSAQVSVPIRLPQQSEPQGPLSQVGPRS